MSLGTALRAKTRDTFNRFASEGRTAGTCPAPAGLAATDIGARLKFIAETLLPWILRTALENRQATPDKWEMELPPEASIDANGVLKIGNSLFAHAMPYEIFQRDEYDAVIGACREHNIRFKRLDWKYNELTFDLSKPFYDGDGCKKLVEQALGSWTEREDGRIRVEGDLNLRNIPKIITTVPDLRNIFLGGRLICGEKQETTLKAIHHLPVMDNPNAIVRTRAEPAPPTPPAEERAAYYARWGYQI